MQGAKREQPKAETDEPAAPPPDSRVSWRGVRLARRNEGAARQAVTEAATPPDERLARKPLVEVEFSFGPRNGLMARLLKRLIKPFG